MAVILLATACSTGRPAPVVSPMQRSHAVGLFLSGATDREIASELSVQPDEAREIVHGAIRELNRKFYGR